jgi:hypothetical protein
MNYLIVKIRLDNEKTINTRKSIYLNVIWFDIQLYTYN